MAAIRAAQLGMKVCLIEKGKLGGVCLNEGCIPTKALIKSASIIEELGRSSEYGIKIKDVSIDVDAIFRRKERIVKHLTDGIKFLLAKNRVELMEGEGYIESENTVSVNHGEKLVETRNIIIATGSENIMPDIPGIDGTNVLSNRDALSEPVEPKTMVIIGGGVIGLEFATYYNSIGSGVTIVEAMNSPLPNMDYDISTYMEERLKEQNIEVITKSYVREIKDNAVVIDCPSREKKIECDKVLIAVGRKPNIRSIVNPSIGLEVDNRAIVTDDTLRTNLKNIYCIGDANGKSMLAHTASAEGIAAVENIAGFKRKVDYRNIPSCVYSIPQVACVGLSEQECRAKGIDYKVGTFPMDANGKALVEGDKGFIKVLVSSDFGEILGVHIIGKHATDLIMEAVLARKNELTAEEIINTVHPHPTISEVFGEVFLNAVGKSIHI